MTFKVKRSEINTAIAEAPNVFAANALRNFDQSVHQHCADVAAHSAHMAKAKDGKADPYPPPEPHRLIARAVAISPSGVCTPDYEIDEDMPSKEAIGAAELANKKTILLNQVSQEEGRLVSAIIPSGKHRAHHFRREDINAADAKRQNEIAAKKKKLDPDELTRAVIAGRPAEDAAFLADHDAKMDSIRAISRHGALLHSEIEDLTADTIDKWTPKSFPK
jgi:hypothetical protein